MENILSLFDGCSGLQQALERANISYDNYYASEINAPAIKVTQHNFPNTIQLGDITKISGKDLPKIDLIGCGSPCQGFSFAGKMLNFNDPRSVLFFEAVRLLNECREKNPDILFLFENVRMKLEYELVFTKYLGVEPIFINSALVSAQNRQRLYWTNIGVIPSNLFGDLKTTIKPPKDKGLVIKDILEKEVDKKYYLSEAGLKRATEGLRNRTANDNDNKTGALLATQGKQASDMLCVRTVMQINDSKESGGKQPYQQNRVYDVEGLNPALMAQLSTGSNFVAYGESQDQRIFFEDSKMGCLSAGRGDTKTKTVIGNIVRRLTPIECERLQTTKDNYTACVADSHRYTMLGNGFTIDVIAHILSHIAH